MWKEVITELLGKGLSEKDIAMRVGVSQPTINRLKLGRRKKVEHGTGEALLALHKSFRQN